MSVSTFSCRIAKRHLEILRDGGVIYDIPVEDLESAKKIAFWWRQLAGKSWMTRELLNEIGQAICGRLNVV